MPPYWAATFAISTSSPVEIQEIEVLGGQAARRCGEKKGQLVSMCIGLVR